MNDSKIWRAFGFGVLFATVPLVRLLGVPVKQSEREAELEDERRSAIAAYNELLRANKKLADQLTDLRQDLERAVRGDV